MAAPHIIFPSHPDKQDTLCGQVEYMIPTTIRSSCHEPGLEDPKSRVHWERSNSIVILFITVETGNSKKCKGAGKDQKYSSSGVNGC